MPTLKGRGPFSYESLAFNSGNTYALNAGSATAPKTQFDSTNGETLEVFANAVLLEGDGSVANAVDAAAESPAHGFYVNSLTAPTSITLVSNVSTGQVVLVRRISNRATPEVDFAPGSVIREQDLDDSTNQTLHVAQEAIDIAIQGIVLDADDKWDAQTSSTNRVIKGVADGVADNDAVNKGQFAVHDAAITADLALTNADVVLTHADVVLTHADEVLTRADTVLTAADVVTTNADVVITNADVVAANASADAVAVIYDAFNDKYLGEMADGATQGTNPTTNGTWAKNSSSITVVSASNIKVGQVVTGTGIPRPEDTPPRPKPNVISIDGTTVVISDNMDALGSAVALTFTGYGIYGTFNVSKDGPALDNDGDALTDGVKYFNTTDDVMLVYNATTSNWKRMQPTSSEQTAINTTATNIAQVQNFAEVYKIAGTAPTSPTPTAGDLWFDTGANVVNAYTGSEWIVATVSDAALLAGATFTGAVTFNGPYVKLPVHANDAARLTAIPSPVNGMIIYNTDAGALQQYNGVWSTIAPAPNISSISGFLNNDNDSTITVFGSNFSTATSVKMFDASSGGSQIGSNATTTFNSVTKLTAVFGAGSIGASGSTAYIEVDNVGSTNRFVSAITVNADPTVTNLGATGTSAVNHPTASSHLGTYTGATVAGGPTDSDTVLLLNFDRPDGSTDFEDSSNTGRTGIKPGVASGNAHIETDHYKIGTAGGKANNSSVFFDGTGDILTLPASAYWNFGHTGVGFYVDSEFTIDWWAKVTTIGTGDIFFYMGGGGLFCSQLSATHIRVQHTSAIAANQIDVAVSFSDNAWRHYAIVRDGNSLKFYVDGTLAGNNTPDTAIFAGSFAGQVLTIGSAPDGTLPYHGYIDVFRLSSTARWATNFTPETSLYGATGSSIIPTITLTGAATQLAADEDIEFTSDVTVENTSNTDGARHLTDTTIGLTLTNLTGGDKNKATLTGTIGGTGGTTYSNIPVKAQVRKTLGNAAYANASRVVTFSGGTVTTGLAPAMPVSGTGIPALTTITSVDSTITITLSADPTGGTLTGQSLIFSDLTRVSTINGPDNPEYPADASEVMMTIATGAGAVPVLFDARRYTGNATIRNLTGMGFQPDLVWIKKRSGTGNHFIGDSVRGATKRIFTNVTAAEDTNTNTVTAFNSDGFTIGTNSDINDNNAATISYGWKAGGAPSGELVGAGATFSGTSGAGTISDTATGVTTTTNITQSVNQTSGFSITKFQGGNDGCSFPHNLGGTPAFIMIKQTDGTNAWSVWHQNLTATSQYYLVLNTDAAEVNYAPQWTTAPSSTIIYCGADDGQGGNSTLNYICYAWKAVAGVSAFGTYTGDGGSARTITTGFQPRFLMVKSLTAGRHWIMHDSFRDGTATTTNLYAELTNAEDASAAYTINFVSTGFAFTSATTIAHINNDSEVFIYAAFA